MRLLCLAAGTLWAAIMLASCVTSSSLGPLDPATSFVPIPEKGSVCRISVRGHVDSGLWLRETSSTVYYGTVVRADAEVVVMSVRLREGRNSVRLSAGGNAIRARVPGVARYFENAGVGRSAAEGEEISIPLGKIEALTQLKAGDPEYALVTGGTAPQQGLAMMSEGDPAVISSPPSQQVPERARRSAP